MSRPRRPNSSALPVAFCTLLSLIVLSCNGAPCRGGEDKPAASKSASDAGQDNLALVVLLGDSIRINYQNTARAELKGKAEVWAPKDNCAHTLFTLENLDKWLKDCDPAIVHINVGLHDLFLDAKTGQPRHSLERYSENLRKIFARLKELTDAKIIFALTTPVDEQRQASSETYKRVVRRNPDIVRYNERAAEIAKDCGVSVDDVHAVALEAGMEDVICDDGVHLTPKGKEIVGRQVARSVLSALAELR